MAWFDGLKAWLTSPRPHKSPVKGDFRIHQFAPNQFVVQIHNGELWKGLNSDGRVAHLRSGVEDHETFAQANEALQTQLARWNALYEGEIERLLGSEVSYYPEKLEPIRKHRRRSWKVEDKALQFAWKTFCSS